MKRRRLTALTDVALITCIVQRGMADRVVRAAVSSGAQGATVYYARGTGVRERLGILGIAVEAEKEVIEIVVATDQADHVFEEMFLAGEMDTPGMGFMYITPLLRAATYIPPEILRRIAKSPSGPSSA